MLTQMRDRGPDGQGVWISKNERLILGHRRLAVIDPSQAASQPMSLSATDSRGACLASTGMIAKPCQHADLPRQTQADDVNQLVVSFNGEIYNFRKLRDELKAQGVQFSTQSDTEVILALYRQDGIAMLRRLRGMFSIILWDGPKERLFLVRDPYGIKPLYYSDDGWTVHVASHVRALSALPNVGTTASNAAIAAFYLLGSVPEPLTIVEKVSAVPAGAYVCVDALGVSEPVVWFDLAARIHTASDSDSRCASGQIATICSAVSDSVNAHLESDVNIGVFLSSGIDSAVVAALAQQGHSKQLDSLTVRFEDFQGGQQDEGPGAALIAEHYGLKHHENVVTRTDFDKAVARHLDLMDQPTLDGINTSLVAGFAQSLSLKVCLSGIGGDELFGGYPSFSDMPRWRRLARILAPVPGMGRALRMGAHGMGLDAHFSSKAISALEYGRDWAGAYLLRRAIFMPWELSQLMGRDAALDGLERLSWHTLLAQHTQSGSSAFQQVSALESCQYMRHQLLRDTDWASMAHGVEVRVPLCDATLLSSIASTHQVRQKYGKALLAKAPARALPDSLLNRSKTGFTLPMDGLLAKEEAFSEWRRQPLLTSADCHWARKLAYCVGVRFAQPMSV